MPGSRDAGDPSVRGPGAQPAASTDGHLASGDHRPVMVETVVELMRTAAGRVVVDCTLGYGGHAEALLSARSAPELLVGIDRDPEALRAATARLAPRFGDRFRAFRAPFSSLASVLRVTGRERVAGVLFDLGVSSPQLDTAERGFSLRQEGPLDMRMDPDQKLTAADVLNSYPEHRLAEVFRLYGEVRAARRLAREIVRRRPLSTTTDLLNAAEAVLGRRPRRRGPRGAAEGSSGHPAQPVFQAVRIEVNRELRELASSLLESTRLLETPDTHPEGRGGRIVCISYHSLEDRLVKRFFDVLSRGCKCPPKLPSCGCGAKPVLKQLTKKPLRPQRREVEENPRARSARLRAAERTDFDATPVLSGLTPENVERWAFRRSA